MPSSLIPSWALIPFAVTMVHAFFWMYIFLFHRESLLARSYLRFAASLMALSAAEFALACAPTHGASYACLRVTGVIAPLTTLLLFFFTARLTGYHHRVLQAVYAVAVGGVILVTGASRHVISDVVVAPEGKYPVPGPLSVVTAAIIFSLTIVIGSYFIAALIRTREADVRRKIRIILIGIIPAVIVTLLFNIIIPYLLYRRTIPNIVSLPSIIISMFVFVAVVRYRVFSDLLPRAAREMFLQIADGVVLCDTDGAVVAMNAHAADMLGITDNDAPLRLASLAGGKLVGTIAPGTEISVGDRTLIVSESPLTNGGVSIGSLITFNDISARKKAEMGLARTNAELTLFASAVSHDLREPLRVISSYIDLLRHRAGGKLSETERGYLDHAVAAAIRLNRMISDLLLFARTGNTVADTALVDMNEVFANARANVMSAAEAGVDVSADVLPPVRGSKQLITLVVQNLIDNAVKFRRIIEPRVHISASSGTMVEITVRDNGIGFDPVHNERIFQLFRRLHAEGAYPGTGVGLALCKKIVEAHGGMIRAESVSGEGTAIIFTLPSA